MVMNHYKRPKRFYVRTRIWYTTEPRTPVYPVAVGDCRHLLQRHGLRRARAAARRARRSSTARPGPRRSTGASSAPASHHHGGAINHTLTSQTCGRTLFDAKAYYGADDHPYNTIRPILHEPGPIANGTFRSLEGVPVDGGRDARARRGARQRDAARGRHGLLGAAARARRHRAPAARRCPADVREVTVPAKYDRAAPYVYSRTVPQLFTPDGPLRAFRRARSATSSSGPAASTARVGQRLTWRFTRRRAAQRDRRQRPARVLLELPRRSRRGSYSFTPTVPGTYRLTCLIHPTTMAQTLRRQTLLKKFRPRLVERLLGLDVEPRQLAGEQQHAHRDQDHAADRRDDQVAVAQPAERGRHAREGDRGEQERDREAERVEREQDAALADRVLGRGGAQDRAERRADARRPGDRERGAGDRAGRRSRRG